MKKLIRLSDVRFSRSGLQVDVLLKSDDVIVATLNLENKCPVYHCPEDMVNWCIKEELENIRKSYIKELREDFDESKPEQLLHNYKFLHWCFNPNKRKRK